MDALESFEAKQLYQVYSMYKRNIITDGQRGRMKDLIIKNDQLARSIMQDYLQDQDQQKFMERLITTCATEEYSPSSPMFSEDNFSHSSRFKGKRPSNIKLPQNTFFSLRKNTSGHSTTGHTWSIPKLSNREAPRARGMTIQN